MKTLQYFLTSLCCLSFFLVSGQQGIGINYSTASGSGQNNYSIDTTFIFNGENRTETLEFILTGEELVYNAAGKIKGGLLKVNLISPNGKKYPGFKLEANGDGTAKGHISEVNDDVPKGTWRVQVINKRATGEINIKMGQN